jgi:uncharacterized protein (DUF488 family)
MLKRGYKVKIYTIGFTKKSAADFFEVLKKSKIQRLIDIRLNNQSQLAGFTKQNDLKYFLNVICAIDYIHEPLLAPNKELLEHYRDKKITWEDYEKRFVKLISERNIIQHINKLVSEKPTVFLCSEEKPDHCHRRLVAEMISRCVDDASIIHL